MITFTLTTRSGVPTYVQLVQQVKQALRLGALVVGDQLPTVKEVVESLAINPNTVSKAYRDLEREGLAAPRPGQGTFIVGTLGATGSAEMAKCRRQLHRWLRSARDAGLDFDDITALIDVEMSTLERELSA